MKDTLAAYWTDPRTSLRGVLEIDGVVLGRGEAGGADGLVVRGPAGGKRGIYAVGGEMGSKFGPRLRSEHKDGIF